jgi:membrane-associated protease RseP (regulator of RpoE activity)
MTKSRLKIAFLALLLVVPTASRVSAGDDPTPPPKVHKEKKKVIVKTPEQGIVVGDDDGVFVEGDFDPELFADFNDFQDFELPGKLQWMSAGGYIGVRPIPMTPELRKHFGAPEDAGVFVGSVEKDGPAEKAGLAVGDIVTAVDGNAIASPRQLSRAVRTKKDGETIQVEVLREGSKKTLAVKVAERPHDEMRVGDLGIGKRGKRFWISPPEPPEPPEPPAAPLFESRRALEQRIHELEKRMQELEGRLPK